MTNQLTNPNEKYYTVKEISEMINVPISTIHGIVKRIMPNKKKLGKTFIFTELEVSEISKELKKAHNIDITSTRKMAVTEYEEAEIVANAIAIMHRKLKELQPKVDSFERFISTENHISIGEFAKTNGIGRNKCFEMLRNNGIIDGKNIPYQQYMKYFIVRQVEKNGILFPTAFINAKGMEYLKGVVL